MYNFKNPQDCTELNQAIDYHAKYLVDRLSVCGLRLSAAESLTGGMFSSAICGVPGASDVFFGSYITYQEKAKRSMLGVSAEVIQRHSVYSNECAVEMATQARQMSGVEIAISASGIAGPECGTPEKPVGTVYIGLADAKRCQFFNTVFSGSRLVVRKKTVLLALMIVGKGLE
ncbi:MAG: CinA family protein [Eggerthellaceae bacterium]|nr:CinA family protein [Eggerthellaceae bacterium]